MSELASQAQVRGLLTASRRGGYIVTCNEAGWNMALDSLG